MTSSPVAKRHKLDDIDNRAVNAIRCLAADMVQKANSGHPGAPMGCAPMAHALFAYTMKFNPKNPKWWNRDRFVLSNGHACALLYCMLHLSGYDEMTMDELKRFRQMGSKTPGHPEFHVTPGVEVTTGPLGQGISNAVGIALAQSHMAANFGTDLFDNYTYVICGDGCLQEGVSSEAASLAGHWGLGRLIVLYDDNKITIDGETHLSFTEDVAMRYKSYGWEVLEVHDGDNDIASIITAINQAKSNLNQPTLIKVHTIIGYGSDKQGTEKVHGSPLGPEDLKRAKERLGCDPEQSFHVPEDVRKYYDDRRIQLENMEREWAEKFEAFKQANPTSASDLTRRFNGALPDGFINNLPTFTSDKATRATSGEVLAALMKTVPELIGGSADLMESTVSNKGNLPPYSRKTPENRIIHYGVREHGMVAIANGIHAYGGLLPVVSTFATFIGYCWGSLRLSALSGHQVLFVATHDSIDLGEDGPTHQPIEILSLLRSTPNVLDIRPADGNETIGAYQAYFSHKHGPTVLLLSRSNLPQLANSSAEGAMHGAYVLLDAAKPRVILAGSGTEVPLLVAAQKILSESVETRVVSFPSWSLFEKQSEQYKQSVFPAGVPVLMVEAARILGSERYATATIEMRSFGASAPAKDLKTHFGFSVEHIVNEATRILLK